MTLAALVEELDWLAATSVACTRGGGSRSCPIQCSQDAQAGHPSWLAVAAPGSGAILCFAVGGWAAATANSVTPHGWPSRLPVRSGTSLLRFEGTQCRSLPQLRRVGLDRRQIGPTRRFRHQFWQCPALVSNAECANRSNRTRQTVVLFGLCKCRALSSTL